MGLETKKGLSYKLLTWLMVAALLLLTAVMIYTGRYAVPCADDFNYGTQVHRSFVETGSVAAALSAAFKTVAGFYTGWQGTFSACFMMAVQPAVFGEQLYFLTPVIMLSSLLAGLFCFCCVVLPEVFGVKKHIAALCAACVGILCTQLVPSPVQGFFWYNGAVYYTFFYGLFLMSIALAVLVVKKGGLVRTALLCALAAFIGGGNYVTALSSAMLAVGFIVLLALMKNAGFKRLILPTLCLLAAFAVSILAPGNAVRQAAAGESMGAVKAVAESFKTGMSYSFSWLSVPLLGSVVFLIPALWQEAKSSKFAFRFPLAVSLLSYCFLSAMFCPSIYALGNEGDKRLVNIIFFAYVLLWVLNVFYWLGWIARKKQLQPGVGRISLVKTVVLLGVMGIGYGAGLFLGNSYTSLMAVGLLRSGDAQLYYDSAMERTEILKDETVTDAVLKDYPVKPYLLFFDDVTTDPNDWRNTAAAEYYGKNSVVLGE